MESETQMIQMNKQIKNILTVIKWILKSLEDNSVYCDMAVKIDQKIPAKSLASLLQIKKEEEMDQRGREEKRLARIGKNNIYGREKKSELEHEIKLKEETFKILNS